MRHTRIVAGLLSAILTGTLLLGAPGRSTAAPPLSVEVNGRPLSDPLIRIEASRLMVPLRALSEALGATVSWDSTERRITINRAQHTVGLQVDSYTAYLDGQPVQLAAAPRIVSDRTIIPYRFLGESLGAQVGWDDASRTAWFWSNLQAYTVADGDSLAKLAAGLLMTVAQLRQVNGLTTDQLAIGQQLRIATTSTPAPTPQGQLRTLSGYTVIAGWGDTRSQDVVQNQGQYLTDIATVSHHVRADGSLGGGPQTATLAAARAHSLRAWLVVQNLDESGTFSSALAAQVLSDPAARQRLADDVLRGLERYGFVGVEIDLEGLAPALRSSYTRLLQELQPQLAARGYLLSAAVPAKTADLPWDGWSGAYDYTAIGQTCDRISLMTYDEHWFGGPSGPIASLPWVEDVVRYATSLIPPEKLLLGVASYAYDWGAGGGPAHVHNGAQASHLAATYGGSWDDAAASPLVRYQDSAGKAHVVWYEDANSLHRKADLAIRYGLQGLNIWRLGLGTPDLLPALRPHS